MKINVVHPATEVHIRKYSKQEVAIVHETPALYERIVKPYIAAFPPSRTQWYLHLFSGPGKHDADMKLGTVGLRTSSTAPRKPRKSSTATSRPTWAMSFFPT